MDLPVNWQQPPPPPPPPSSTLPSTSSSSACLPPALHAGPPPAMSSSLYYRRPPVDPNAVAAAPPPPRDREAEKKKRQELEAKFKSWSGPLIKKRREQVKQRLAEQTAASKPMPLPEQEEQEFCAILPPIESFMGVSAEDRMKAFFKDVQIGDVIISRVERKTDTGLICLALTLQSGMRRDLTESGAAVFCSFLKAVSPDRRTCAPPATSDQSVSSAATSDQSVSSAATSDQSVSGSEPTGSLTVSEMSAVFNQNDLLALVVVKVVRTKFKVFTSMKPDDLPDGKKHLRLGLVDNSPDDLPVHYIRLLQAASEGKLYEDILTSTPSFNNPACGQYLVRKLLQLPKPKPGSGVPVETVTFFSNRVNRVYEESECAPRLRQQQNKKAAAFPIDEGLKALREGRHLESEQWLTKAIRIDPQSVDAYTTRGVLYAIGGHFLKALPDFDRALRIDENNAKARSYCSRTLVDYAHNLLADAQSAQTLVPTQQVEKLLRKAIEIDGKNEKAKSAFRKFTNRSPSEITPHPILSSDAMVAKTPRPSNSQSSTPGPSSAPQTPAPEPDVQMDLSTSPPDTQSEAPATVRQMPAATPSASEATVTQTATPTVAQAMAATSVTSTPPVPAALTTRPPPLLPEQSIDLEDGELPDSREAVTAAPQPRPASGPMSGLLPIRPGCSFIPEASTSRKRSPNRSPVRSPGPPLDRSPIRRSRSPIRRSRSPIRSLNRSPVRSPIMPLDRSPIRGGTRSPIRGYGRSPSPERKRSRIGSRSPIRQRSPVRERSPLRGSRSPIRAISRPRTPPLPSYRQHHQRPNPVAPGVRFTDSDRRFQTQRGPRPDFRTDSRYESRPPPPHRQVDGRQGENRSLYNPSTRRREEEWRDRRNFRGPRPLSPRSLRQRDQDEEDDLQAIRKACL